MFRKILESTLGSISNDQFQQTLDLATTDIKVNRIAFGKRTSLKDAVTIAVSCFVALGRGKAA